MEPSIHAVCQYSNTSDKLAARLAILAFDTNSQSWFSWLEERLLVAGDVLELRKLEIPGATVEQCDAANLPFPDSSFDLVIANHMLYHLDDPDSALKEFARVLRPGGRLRIALNGRERIAELIAIGSAIGRPSMILNAARITAETGPEYLSKHFQDVTAEPFPGEFDVPNPEPILAYVSSWGDEPLTSEQDATARSLIKSKINAEGSFRIRKDMVLLSARRP